MTHSRFSFALRLAASLSALSLAACGGDAVNAADTEPADAASSYGFSPFVDAEGAISRPTGFKTSADWIHLGTWAVVNENGEGNGFHNVYTTRAAADDYRANGAFPDGAPLVKEVRGAAAEQLTTGRAHWATDKQVWFVMIKDAEGRFPDNALWGDGWGWALFNAEDPAEQVATDYKSDCLGCHIPAQQTDWVYTRAYSAVLEGK
ncbi:MAG: cytochrome P460 family protein [Pseudomonadota bacterium]